MNWFWVPFIGPHLGAILGALVYQVFVGIHAEPDDLVTHTVELDDVETKRPKKIQLEIKVNDELSAKLL
jgi:hypothetical protein